MLEKWDINITVLHCNEEVDVHEVVEGEVEKYKKGKKEKVNWQWVCIHPPRGQLLIPQCVRESVSALGFGSWLVG
jgi:hypothetical protein